MFAEMPMFMLLPEFVVVVVVVPDLERPVETYKNTTPSSDLKPAKGAETAMVVTWFLLVVSMNMETAYP